ncbi:adenosylmethionine--8-amino-7-oxononanoate transaminase [Caldimonas tepidiphila]|uniref:adenosylmethionine--8-amino-7-oxononanoate transaminase n=1 Tax=Caldimonas tepidiphila TaxID=2315841 RepID=UPI000E5BCF30|nr:adenosylmethionine--8-amino-7-oxononanoate transaminase [Caldimonas tepidiphila]
MDSQELLALDRAHCWHPFTQAQTAAPPLLIERAAGAHLFAADGRRYFDAVSSWWVNLHGHAHTRIAEAIAQQARQMEQVMFAGLTHAPAIELAAALAARLPPPLQHVFFSDNGSTAIEVALKMCVQYWANRGRPRRRFLSLEGGYHGDTFGAMAAGRSSGFYGPFADWLFEVDVLPCAHGAWDTPDADLEAAERAALAALDAYLSAHGDELVAFVLEPLVQGASGMRMQRAAHVAALVRRVQAAGVPVIFDEVMTGFGRTGTLFACEQVGVAPDIICLSKGLTGGFLPMGATVAQPHLYEAFLGESVERALLHGHSYTANPLGCAAALASLRVFDEEATLARIAAQGALHEELLRELAAHPLVRAPRRCGSIAAFDLRLSDAGYGSSAGQWLRERMRERGVLLRPLGTSVYFIAPYCSSEDDFRAAYAALREVLDAWPRGAPAGASEHF